MSTVAGENTAGGLVALNGYVPRGLEAPFGSIRDGLEGEGSVVSGDRAARDEAGFAMGSASSGPGARPPALFRHTEIWHSWVTGLGVVVRSAVTALVTSLPSFAYLSPWPSFRRFRLLDRASRGMRPLRPLVRAGTLVPYQGAMSELRGNGDPGGDSNPIGEKGCLPAARPM
jgi:hypothetical protein